MFELIHRKLDILGGKLDLLLQRQQVDSRELAAIKQMEIKEMASIDDLVGEVAKEKDEIASVKTFVAGIESKLADALAGASLSPANQAKVDQLFVDLQANSSELAGAIVEPGAGGAA